VVKSSGTNFFLEKKKPGLYRLRQMCDMFVGRVQYSTVEYSVLKRVVLVINVANPLLCQKIYFESLYAVMQLHSPQPSYCSKYVLPVLFSGLFSNDTIMNEFEK
jgi:hypothetical protein